MSKFYISFLTLVCFVAAPIFGQQTKLLTADKHNEYGLVYSLPTTTLNIEITATRTVKKAGPFFQYAKKYIGVELPVTADSETWSIKSVRVTADAAADKSEQYLMQLKPGALTNLCVDTQGLLLAINQSVTLEPQQVAASTLLGPSSLDEGEYLKYVNEDFLASQSSAKRAQLLYESLMEVRDSKVSLSRGTAETMPTDGKQLELMLNSLAEQERVMTEAFTGTTQTQTVVKTYTFTPADDNIGRSVLMRLSDFAGFVDADDYSGDPLYINVNVTKRGELPVDDKGESKHIPKDAVIYNIPGRANIQLTLNGNKLFDGDFDIAQFGTRFGLKPDIFTAKKEASFAIFDRTTGAITELGTLSDQQ